MHKNFVLWKEEYSNSNINLTRIISNYFKWNTFGFKFLSLTCCSRLIMTSTAMFRMLSLVCGLSDFKWLMQILPSSFKASLISRIRILSLALFADLLSFSLTTFVSGSTSSSSCDFRFFPLLAALMEVVLGVGESELCPVSLKCRLRLDPGPEPPRWSGSW